MPLSTAKRAKLAKLTSICDEIWAEERDCQDLWAAFATLSDADMEGEGDELLRYASALIAIELARRELEREADA